MCMYHWNHGEFDGVEEGYDKNSGKRTFTAHWKMGKLDGKYDQYANDGKLISEKTFENGADVTHPTPQEQMDKALTGAVETPAATHSTHDSAEPVVNINTCVNGWTAAYHKEQGEDAMITTDQLDEWTQWCQQGKQASVN